MIENLPQSVSIIFILTTFLTVGFFIYAMKRGAFSSKTTAILNFLIPFWLFFQAVLALGGFYLITDVNLPHLPLFGILPAILLVISLFVFTRKTFIERMPLKTLTLINIIRIPVELVLLWLFKLDRFRN